MLALAYAAAHQGSAGPIVLVCSGTFDLAARERFSINLSERKKDEGARQRFDRALQISDPSDRFRELGKQTLELYSYDLATTEQEVDESEPGAGAETWDDMVRLQNESVYPATFTAIKAPVLMLHGAVDPHPGEMIRASLAPYIPQLEYANGSDAATIRGSKKPRATNFLRSCAPGSRVDQASDFAGSRERPCDKICDVRERVDHFSHLWETPAIRRRQRRRMRRRWSF
jgi:pimeloyl-ACP methyl ester carboxylesterase